MKAIRHFAEIPRHRNVIEGQSCFNEHGPGGHLPMNIEKQVFDRDCLRLALLVGTDIAADQLNDVIQKKAESELKDGRFRSPSDQTLQMKDFRNFLEHLLDAPALQVVRQQIFGGIQVAIQKVGDNHHIRLARAQQRNLPHIVSFGMIRRPHPAPFLTECSALRIHAQSGRAPRIWMKADFGMPTHQKMVSSFCKFRHALQVAKTAVCKEQENPRNFAAYKRQQVGNEPNVIGVAILVGVHCYCQSRFEVYPDQCAASQEASPHSSQKLQTLGHFLDCLAVKDHRIERPQRGGRLAPGPGGKQFPQRAAQVREEGLTHSERKPTQFAVCCHLRRCKFPCFLSARKALVAASPVLQESIPHQLYQTGESDHSVVTSATSFIENRLQSLVVRYISQNFQYSLRQRYRRPIRRHPCQIHCIPPWKKVIPDDRKDDGPRRLRQGEMLTAVVRRPAPNWGAASSARAVRRITEKSAEA